MEKKKNINVIKLSKNSGFIGWINPADVFPCIICILVHGSWNWDFATDNWA
jgi:hypothetical protein